MENTTHSFYQLNKIYRHLNHKEFKFKLVDFTDTHAVFEVIETGQAYLVPKSIRHKFMYLCPISNE